MNKRIRPSKIRRGLKDLIVTRLSDAKSLSTTIVDLLSLKKKAMINLSLILSVAE